MSTGKASLNVNVNPKIDPTEIVSKLTTISVQVSSLPVINSDDDYNLAYEIRSKIKLAIKFIHSKTKPNIKRWHDGHKAALSDERDLVKPFDDLDKQLDEMMKEWNRLKKEREQAERLEREKELKLIAESLLSEETETESITSGWIETDSGVSGVTLTESGNLINFHLPAFIPDKPRGERIYKRIKIIDPSKFNPEFIQFFLSDSDVQEAIRKWLEKQSKLLGGFEVLLDLSGLGSIEQVEDESISIRT